MDGEELGLLLKQERGQFLDFVSAYEYKKSAAQKKNSEDLARDLARLLAGMANADGGTLLVGVEPDKSVTGIPYRAEEIQALIQSPQAMLNPPLHPSCQKLSLGNLLLLKFEVSSSLEVHRVAGGRTFYRIATENPCLPAEQIQSLKESKRYFFYERQHVLDAAWEDLDSAAVAAFTDKIKDPRDPRTVLAQSYHLVDCSRDKVALTMACLLLFAKDPSRWHQRCGIDFVKYEGTERRHGSSLNVIKRIRFEAPLSRLIDEAVGRVKEHIRERTILHDLFFRERLEYPTFAWQEALVNAVAHRDYSLSGAPVEMWMFDDRIEVRSPGLPPSPVTVEQLRQQKRVHFARNPLLVRVLADLGYLQEIGEGVPRMFQEMDHHGLRAPEFSTEGFFFTVTLHNTPIYDEATLRWLNQFGASTINFRQRRLLAYAYSHAKSFSTADYQRVAEVDRDTAYREIRAMVKLGIVNPLKPKSRAYRIIERL
ncbi:MAG: putative DNA binding domain-containing protein [Deltaproteobacteria bacterium]|nr:putative DNA binding domain-containing protein [Deltaproteobacteria bacterium]